MDAPSRILIIRPSALGDVARSVPLASALHRHWPDARIDWLINTPYADVVRAHPGVASVIPFDRKGLGSSARGLNLFPIRRFLRELRAQQYDLVIEAQGLLRSGVFAWATRAKERIGFADAREMGWLGLTTRVRVDPSLHTVDRMLKLLEPLGVDIAHPDMRLYTPAESRENVDRDPDLSAPYVVLAPTSLWAGKRWAIERHVEIARRVMESGLKVVAIGGPSEREQCETLTSLPGVIDRVGKTSVGEMMAIIERAVAVVASDSAALHIAVGFDRACVALFGPTSVSKVGPYQREGDVIQHVGLEDTLDHKNEEAGRRIMDRITVDEVWSRLRAHLCAD